jgi:predicted amidohydrolase
MQQTIRVAAVQLNSQEDLEANLAQCTALTQKAADQGAELVLLPENFAYYGPEIQKRQLAEPFGEGRIQEAVAAMAARSGAIVVAGGWPERSADAERPFNTCTVVSPTGAVIARYRKIHLFDVELPDGTQISESIGTTAGEEPVVATVADFRLGLSICYDLRFPELYRRLSSEGAEAHLVSAAFTLQTGRDHWHILLRARAIESQCWVVAAAQWGSHFKGRASYGHAMVVDPWGAVVAECSDRVGVIVADLDRSYLKSIRSKLPALRHRRL